MDEWTIVIPVKGTSAAKSRFGPGDHSDLALAMALDTVEAAREAALVRAVVVVTVGGPEFQSLGARVVQDPGTGLIGAIEAGLQVAESPTGVLLGDHPGLQPEELSSALMAAAEHPRSIVADDEGTGSALVTALEGYRHELEFGPDSRSRHVARGYVELDGAWPGLRRDVDRAQHLDDLAESGLALGRRTRALLRRH